MKKIYLALAALLSFFFLLSASLSGGEKTETFEKSLPIDSSRPVFIEFKDVDGDLHFTPWEENFVKVQVTKKTKLRDARRAERLLRETEVRVSQKGNSIKIEIRYPQGEGIFFWFRDYGRINVSTEIMLPFNSNLACRTDDGSISGEKVKGEMVMETEDGSIRLSGIEGSVRALTDDGRIILMDIKGAVEAETVDGDIFCSGQIKKLLLSSEDGDIEVKLAPQSFMEEDWKISTEDGDVELYLPSTFSADFILQTEDGDINCEIPAVFTEFASKRKLAGRINQGGNLLTITTEDGDILLQKLSASDWP